jgi:hypothetical protein
VGVEGKPSVQQIIQLRPLRATDRAGVVYRLPKRFLSGERWDSWEAFDFGD